MSIDKFINYDDHPECWVRFDCNPRRLPVWYEGLHLYSSSDPLGECGYGAG
jgi:hypothetical protein